MLPDFPKSRNEIHKRLLLRMHLASQAKTPLRDLGMSVTQHEGVIHSYEQEMWEGTRTVTEGFHEISVPIHVEIDDIPQLVGAKLFERIDAIADDVARQQSQITFQMLDRVTREAGTSVDAAGGPPTKELWLEMLQRGQLDFDPTTKRPEITFISGVGMAETMRRLWSEWEEDIDFMKRYHGILAEKYEEWRDRESRRKLVD